MAVENLQGSNVITGMLSSPIVRAAPGLASGRISTFLETVEITAGASATSTYHMARLTSSARILPGSTVHYDAVSPADVDVGIFAVNSGEVTDDADALLDGDDWSSAGSTALVSDIADYGKPLWELAGLSADPVCDLDIKVTINGTATNGGTVTLYLEFATH